MKKSTVLTEKDVLEKLDIPDFHHLSKGKMTEFASMLPYMDKEVAKKALEQFPNFANSACELFKEYSDLCKNALQADTINNQRTFDIIEIISEAMQEELKQPDLTFEQKQVIMNNLLKIQDEVIKLNESNKKHSLKIILLVSSILTLLVSAMACMLGINSKKSGSTIEI